MELHQQHVDFSNDDISSLHDITTDPLYTDGEREKAKILLAIADSQTSGETLKNIASKFKVARNTVFHLRDDFVRNGVKAVFNGEVPGRGGAKKEERKATLLKFAETPLPDGHMPTIRE